MRPPRQPSSSSCTSFKRVSFHRDVDVIELSRQRRTEDGMDYTTRVVRIRREPVHFPASLGEALPLSSSGSNHDDRWEPTVRTGSSSLHEVLDSALEILGPHTTSRSEIHTKRSKDHRDARHWANQKRRKHDVPPVIPRRQQHYKDI